MALFFRHRKPPLQRFLSLQPLFLLLTPLQLFLSPPLLFFLLAPLQLLLGLPALFFLLLSLFFLLTPASSASLHTGRYLFALSMRRSIC